MPMKKYKNLIFDVGDVLLSYRWKDMLMKDHGLSEEDAERIGQEMFCSPYWAILDLGTLSEEEVMDGYDLVYPEDGDHIRWFISHGELMQVPRPRVWEKVKELKDKGYKLYYLSNYSEGLFKKHTGNYPFLGYMDGGIVSYEIHITKPDHRIYERLLAKYNLDARDCLFFDDRQVNTKAAEEIGIDSVTVKSEEFLLEELDEL